MGKVLLKFFFRIWHIGFLCAIPINLQAQQCEAVSTDMLETILDIAQKGVYGERLDHPDPDECFFYSFDSREQLRQKTAVLRAKNRAGDLDKDIKSKLLSLRLDLEAQISALSEQNRWCNVRYQQRSRLIADTYEKASDPNTTICEEHVEPLSQTLSEAQTILELIWTYNNMRSSHISDIQAAIDEITAVSNRMTASDLFY